MQAARLPDLKKELKQLSDTQLLDVCIRLTKYKKENKELLTYLLFESHNEELYISRLKEEIDDMLEDMVVRSIRDSRKGIRKILKFIDRWVKFSLKKPTEVEIRLHFCKQIQKKKFPIRQNFYWSYVYRTQLNKIERIVPKLHEDLQFDYQEMLDEIGPYL